MTAFETRLEQALGLMEAGRLHGDRHVERPYGKRGDRAPAAYASTGAATQPAGSDRETSKYSLRFKFDETIMAMAEVEGMGSGGPYDDRRASEWFDKQYTPIPGTATTALKKLKEMLRLTPGRHVDLDEGMAKVTVITGSTANRWNVYLNGMIALDSKYVASGGAIKKAQQLGFDVE